MGLEPDGEAKNMSRLQRLNVRLAILAIAIPVFGCDRLGTNGVSHSTVHSESVAAGKPKLSEPLRLLGGEPLRVEMRIPNDVRTKLSEALAVDPPGTVKLTVKVVPPGKSGPVNGLSVHVNLPADHQPADLSEVSKHWVGAVEFQPIGDSIKPQSFNFDLSEPLARMLQDKEWSPDDPITITLNAIPSDPEQGLPDDLKIPVKKMELSVPAKEKR